MFVIVDDRDIVTTGYATSFDREGVASTGLRPDEFAEWVSGVGKPDLQAVEAFLIGDCSHREIFPRLIRERCVAPVIALNDLPSLEQTLELFAAGMDDVVRKPVHVREIMARVGAIRRRKESQPEYKVVGEMRVYFDGRDPEVGGVAAAAAAPRAPDSGISGAEPVQARDQDPDLQRHLRPVRRRGRGGRGGKPYQQAAQEAAPPPWLRPHQFQALSRLLSHAQLKRRGSDPLQGRVPRAAFFLGQSLMA